MDGVDLPIGQAVQAAPSPPLPYIPCGTISKQGHQPKLGTCRQHSLAAQQGKPQAAGLNLHKLEHIINRLRLISVSPKPHMLYMYTFPCSHLGADSALVDAIVHAVAGEACGAAGASVWEAGPGGAVLAGCGQ